MVNRSKIATIELHKFSIEVPTAIFLMSDDDVLPGATTAVLFGRTINSSNNRSAADQNKHYSYRIRYRTRTAG